ncbi:(2Fe-2S) ferredoxin domain-containing protein [Thermocoleostomius sinensis]|uniref:(2Fe-2S) ferredoxin domain-containing protein n=1 Tax=Thermocoleostomius sinensis A174 TaxID=2016057 RepID=A0A9E8ZCY6_9CYAN|nr:(2Fe-2S) ferredoxin domain-containing protein [Thermocoleostomius sinensis]WAL58965.1 (2Fe-2S) ferredoxin domain-containing protein [Thermocoleostomius sinensis A174]
MSSPKRRCVLVCQHRSCARNGAADVLATFQQAAPCEVFVSGSDCLGQCASGPTVQVMPDGTWYCRIKPSDVAAIVEQHLQNNQPIANLLHPRFHPRYDSPLV